MKKGYFVGTFLGAAAAVLFVATVPLVKVLSVSNLKNPTENIFSAEAVKNGWDICYTHSVNKGRVRDYYRVVDKNGLELYKTEFVSYGAGIPEADETPGAFFSSDEHSYAIENLHRTIPKLVMAVGVIAEHSISIDGREFFLKNVFMPQTSLVFRVKRISVLRFATSQQMTEAWRRTFAISSALRFRNRA